MGDIKSDNNSTPSLKGKSLFDFADTLSIRVPTSCGRTGECHECIIQVTEGLENLSEKKDLESFLGPEFRLACQAIINNDKNDVSFNVLRRQPKILDKGNETKFSLNPSVILKDNQVIFRKDNRVLNEKMTPIYGVAVDLGTTTVVCSILDLTNGEKIGTSSFENPQRFGGSDTLNRISYETTKFPGELKSVIISGLNFEIGELCKKNKIRRSYIYEMMVVGNTTMRDIFFGIDVASVGQKPYKSITQLELEKGKRDSTSLIYNSSDLGIRINKNGLIISPPLISSHIGSDITADLVSISADTHDENFILLDVGTNTEIVLGNKDNLVAASCPAGPAFEGGEVKYAMPGYDGAIEKFEIHNGKEIFTTINNHPPQGICGSGLIDLLAALKSNSIINELGVLSNGGDHYEIINTNGINISRSDMSALAQAKAANYCGQSIALKNSSIDISKFDKLYLSGGFANYINVENAIKIGFIIDTPNAEIIKIGNSALQGAIMLLLDINLRSKFDNLVKSIKHIELETDENFFEHFVEGCQFKELSIM
ncbi:MAG: ferredoxin [Dehalococcoidia bacterium]|nr:ferredoxin [Dehalococcoidia bacterium]|tara:strand:- start:1573 stop:3195 length:1623 start_codon:yes stop_codon:yes gene_type:complete